MKIIISLLSILIFFTLILTYIKISKPFFPKEEKKEIVKKETKEKFKVLDFKYYPLPARVLYEKIDFRQIKAIILYKLTIKNRDKFAIFNIVEVLRNNNISYSMIKEKNTQIYVVFRSLKEAEKILNIFKYYNFPVKLQKIKKRI